MGKGTIIANLGNGQYSITLNRDIRRITTRLTRVNARISALETIIVDLTASMYAAEADYNAALAEMNQIIADMKDHPEQLKELQAQLIVKTKETLEKQRVWQGWIAALNAATIEKASLAKEKTALEDPGLADPTVTAWCSDRSLTLSGEVGTIEVPGERGSVNIKPGYQGGQVYAANTDGKLQPTKAGTPSSVFYNWAMFPGWQKWKPTYRYGTIVAKDGNSCTVLLDTAVSSAQDLAINASSTLTSVPIEYMSCNGAAFNVGDAVIVKFASQDLAQPKVIGFKSNPKECPGGVFCAMFEKPWQTGWLASPYPITAGDMFMRFYFKFGEDGKPFWITEAQAESEAYLTDSWSSLLYRDWITGPSNVSPAAEDNPCQYYDVAGRGRDRTQPWFEYTIPLSVTVKLVIASCWAGLAAWTKEGSSCVVPKGGYCYKYSPMIENVESVGRWNVSGTVDKYWRGYFVSSEPFSYWSDNDDKLDSSSLRSKMRYGLPGGWDGSSDPPSAEFGQFCTWALDPQNPYCTPITGTFNEVTAEYYPPGSGGQYNCYQEVVDNQVYGKNSSGDSDVYRNETTWPYYNYLLNILCMTELHSEPNEVGLFLRVERTAGGSFNVYIKQFEEYWIDGEGVYQGADHLVRIVVDSSGNITSMGYWSGSWPEGVTVLYDVSGGIYALDLQTTDLTSVQMSALVEPGSGYPYDISTFAGSKFDEVYGSGWVEDPLTYMALFDGVCRLLSK
jgi:hypothetical protein